MTLFRRVRIGLVLMAAVILVAVLSTGWSPDWPRVSIVSTGSAAEDLLSRAASTQSVTDRQISTLQERLRNQPNDAWAYVQLGAAYLQKVREVGDPVYYTKAEGVLREALALIPDDSEAMGLMGNLALARHQFQEALEWGQRAHQLNPTRAYNLGVIGDAQLELGDYDAAFESFQKMVNMRPDLSSYSRVSYARELLGDVEGAIEAMRMAAQAGGPNAENTNWARVQLGHLYFNSGRLDEAETEYRLALSRYPGYVHAEAGLARIHAARGEYREAIKLYNDIVQRMPLPEYVIALGEGYQAAGQLRDAERQYKLVRALQELYAANGADTNLEMALFNADHGQDPAATIVQARQTYARRPSIHAADVLAWALYQAGDYPEAQKYSEEALRLGTQDALKLFHAGMIAYRLGDKIQARDHLERALNINPYFSVLYVDDARRVRLEIGD